MSTETVLVIGANRGIGFELATRFLKRGYKVFGTYRPQTKEDVSVAELKSTGVQTIELDYGDEASIIDAAKTLDGAKLDILINCGAIYNTWDEKPFIEQTADDLLSHFKINVVDNPRIITMSSDFASIADNTGGNVCYRISKSGVNQLTRTMAIDLGKLGSRVKTLAVHPGWLQTKMTEWTGDDDMDECMSSLVEVVARFGTAEGADIPNGGYVKWNGDIMAY
ncbi:hypothetical protein B0T21DRAFT_417206 [Apiosordaria backusii]|uniref:Uncharacterized protein n=1 Tax=Apiosordaria backusii TaxID=314023 RepID=A0AA39ZPN0_9PEZI|nr:hypothetical protein B0T21DRAFT_417206 [Apiosordaria backusii]